MTSPQNLKQALTKAYETAVIVEAQSRGLQVTDFGTAMKLLPIEVGDALKEAFRAQIEKCDE